MAKFIDLEVIVSKAQEPAACMTMTFNSDYIVRFFDVDENEVKYWGYYHTILEYTDGNSLKSIRVKECQRMIKELIDSLQNF